MRRLLLHLLLPALFVPAACERRSPNPSAESAQPTTYQVNGVVREIRPNGREVSIAHEAIPGYMEAMTMDFEPAEANELAGLRPGDAISFRLVVTPEHGWIEGIQRRPGVRGAALQPPVTPAAENVLSIGDRLPDAALVDQAGSSFHLSELRGKPLALTFIFTRCPFPDYCPRLNAQFASAQKALPSGEAQLLSISIDPVYDTPARLTEHAARYQPDPAKWRFATGEVAEIQRLGAAMGLVVTPENGTLSHSLRTVVVDSAGRIDKVFSGNAWTAADLVDALKAAGAKN